MARKGDKPEHVLRMQKVLFEVLGDARSREGLLRIVPKAQEVLSRYTERLRRTDIWELGHPSQG